MRFDISNYWYRRSWHVVTLTLLPLSWLFAAVVSFRRYLYHVGIISHAKIVTPVVVVGNITAGGTGKTPFVIWLAAFLKSRGYRPGIVSRGVGGKRHRQPHWVSVTSSVQEVGDEALLLAQQTHCPVVICTDRASAAKYLLSRSDCNIIISDDGLQHYKLNRHIEIALIDGVRELGNRCYLPAGPLREPASRLKEVDFVVVNYRSNPLCTSAFMHAHPMQLEATHMASLKTNATQFFNDFTQKKVHAIAGIGHPEQFFMMLREKGFDIIPHAFSDHYAYQAKDITFADDLPIVMTEKDAVKCLPFANNQHWSVKAKACMTATFECELIKKLKTLKGDNDVEAEFTTRTCDLARDYEHESIRL